VPLIRSDRFHGGLDTRLARARTNALKDALFLTYFLEKITNYIENKRKKGIDVAFLAPALNAFARLASDRLRF
jgi:hypothetical protein